MSPRYDVEVVDVGGVIGDGGLFATVIINGQSAGAVWRPDSSAARPWHAELRTPVISPLGAVSVERSRHETKRAAVAWVVVKALGGQWRASEFGYGDQAARRDLLPLLPPVPPPLPAGFTCCGDSSPSRPTTCDRPAGHSGRHAAYGIQHVIGVWHQAPGAPASETTGVPR